MPSYICEALFGQCNAQYASDADSQQGCEDNIKSLCGTINVSKADVGGDDDDEDGDDSTETSATTASPSATGTGGSNDDDGDDSDNVTTTNSDDFAAPTAGPQVVAALGAMGLFAAFV